jgi:hypothetical protein
MSVSGKVVIEHSRKIYDELLHADLDNAGWPQGVHDAKGRLIPIDKAAGESHPS